MVGYRLEPWRSTAWSGWLANGMEETADASAPNLFLDLDDLVARYGYNVMALDAVGDHLETYSRAGIDGALRYRRASGVRLVAGDPLARREDVLGLLVPFLEESRLRRERVVLLPATERLVGDLRAAGLGAGAIKIGEEGYYDLHDWSLCGRHLKHVRNQINRTARAGIVAGPLDLRFASDRDLAQIRSIIADWYATRKLPPLDFLMRVDPFDRAEVKRCFVARHQGRIVGYVSCHPAPERNGWLLAEIIRGAGAPEGTTELLVKTAFEQLRDEGARWATLGLAPLANVLAGADDDHQRFRRLLDRIYRHSTHLYRFQSLHFFKSKFQPATIEPVYALVWPDAITPRVLWAVAEAFLPRLNPRDRRPASRQAEPPPAPGAADEPRLGLGLR
jgi:phosphatidylglycerol lysyltransferase